MSLPGGITNFLYKPGRTLDSRIKIKTNCNGNKNRSLFFLSHCLIIELRKNVKNTWRKIQTIKLRDQSLILEEIIDKNWTMLWLLLFRQNLTGRALEWVPRVHRHPLILSNGCQAPFRNQKIEAKFFVLTYFSQKAENECALQAF